MDADMNPPSLFIFSSLILLILGMDLCTQRLVLDEQGGGGEHTQGNKNHHFLLRTMKKM